jgi:hypothetical protein
MTERFANIWDAIEDDPAQRENMKVRSALMSASIGREQIWCDSTENLSELASVTGRNSARYINFGLVTRKI